MASGQAAANPMGKLRTQCSGDRPWLKLLHVSIELPEVRVRTVTPYRTETASKIANEVRLSVLRGNGGEIGIFANVGGDVKGVESSGGPEQPAQVAKALAKERGFVVAITGPTDYVVRWGESVRHQKW